MNFTNDPRTVMTLDAGGTNFVFGAIRGCEEIVEPIHLPSAANNLELSLANLINGFHAVRSRLKEAPVAISFAFPGPADYPNGIIWNIGNLPAYKGGVAVGPMLAAEFGIPTCMPTARRSRAICRGSMPSSKRRAVRNGIATWWG